MKQATSNNIKCPECNTIVKKYQGPVSPAVCEKCRKQGHPSAIASRSGGDSEAWADTDDDVPGRTSNEDGKAKAPAKENTGGRTKEDNEAARMQHTVDTRQLRPVRLAE